MAPLRPEDLNVSALPRGPLGHLKTEPVSELLQRAAWDYREALGQNQRLASTVEELTRRVEELTAQVSSLEEAAARRKDPDELARTLLASAQRAAREERESARRDAELLLQKAARRAEKLEQDIARRAADRRAELAQLEALKEDVAAGLRGLLRGIVGRYGDAPKAAEEPKEAAISTGRKR